jgi:hypothetical protein
VLIQRENNRILIFFVFGFFLLINIASNGGHFDTYDGIETFLVTESMVLHHSAKLYPDVPSIQKLHWQSKPLQPTYTYRSLLLSAIALPFYYAAIFFSASPITLVAFFVNPLILALTSVVIFCFSLEVYRSRKIAFILSLIFGICSFAWSYTTTLLPQPLQAFLIITSVFFIYKAAKQKDNNNNKTVTNNEQNFCAIMAGILLGFSLFAHPTSAIVFPALVVYSIFSMWHNNRRKLVVFLVALCIAISFAGFVNYWRFGSFTEFGYGNQAPLSVHHGWKGLVGLLASPGKGIIFYFPIVILLPLALKYMYMENKKLFFLFTYVIFAFWLFFGTDDYWDPHTWAGDIGWGPRYLVPILPFITIAFGTILVQLKNTLFLKLSIIILCGLSFFVSFLGIIVWYQYGLGYGWSSEGLWQYDNIKFRGDLKVSSWDIMTWFPQYSPIILHMKVLMSDFVSKIPAEFTGNGLAPCSYDLYIFCKYGAVPIFVLSVAISIILLFILRLISNSISKPRIIVD